MFACTNHSVTSYNIAEIASNDDMSEEDEIPDFEDEVVDETVAEDDDDWEDLIQQEVEEAGDDEDDNEEAGNDGDDEGDDDTGEVPVDDRGTSGVGMDPYLAQLVYLDRPSSITGKVAQIQVA